MRKETRILMLGGAKRVSLARLLKAAGERIGTKVSIFSSEIIETVPIVVEGKVLKGRKWRDADIYEHFDEVIAKEKIDIVLPFVDGAIEVCSRLKERHPEVFIPVSDFDTAHQMFDKCEAAELFEKVGIAIPKTLSMESDEFPKIFKPREGSASKGIKVIENAEEQRLVSNPENYLIQEYIADREEYTVDCYVSMMSGKPLCTVPRLRISTSGGEVDRTETRRIPELISMSQQVLKAIGFQGPVTLQFIHDLKNGGYKLMEINPRLGGGVVCSIHAGADIAEMILRESMGEEAKEMNEWRDHALMVRYFSEVMF